MAQTITNMHLASKGSFDRLKLVVLNVANGANETSVAINYATYGLNTVILYGHVNKDAYTTGSQVDAISGTTVTHTWTGNDLLDALVWAIGF